MLARSILSILMVAVMGLGHAVLAEEPGFRDPDLPFAQRVDDLLKRLTVSEKIGLLMMDSQAVPRLGIPAYHFWNEGLHGVARNGTATVFPQAIGLAATWNPALEHQIAEVISTEARAKNNETLSKTGGSSKIYQGLTIWSPNINIFRDPRWGRGQETYGEDPYLTAQMGVAFVRGLQGDDPHYLKTVATLKHYAVHSGPEESRHRFNAAVSDRDLHETYLPAFEAGIHEGGAWSIMSAYNAINGVPAPANKYLLTDLLREQWKFPGAVVGDVDTVGDIWKKQSHQYAADAAEASALALKAGNDLCSGTTYAALPDALKRGLVNEDDLDRALRRLLLLRFKLGQFDPPERVPYRSIPISEVNSPAHDALALEAARQSLVLLKNDGTLPWKIADIKTLAVLGPCADDYSALVGNYNGTPVHPVTILQGLRERLEPLGVKVLYNPAVPLVEGFRENGHPLPPGLLFTDASRKTPGLRMESFDNADFAGHPFSSSVDSQVEIVSRRDQPSINQPAPEAHLRWTGVLVPPASGNYALAITFVGAAQFYLDDKLVEGESKFRDPGEVRTRGKSVHLQAGHAYRLRIEYHQGADDPTVRVQFGWRTPNDLQVALALAAKADHILIVAGITPSLEGEEMKITADGFSHGDRTSILLPQTQRALIEKVAALGKPFTVVLTNGSALSFDTSKPNAIIDAWYYGQKGGQAVTEALLGDINPSGHLPITFYQSDADLPSFTNYSMANRTYRYFRGKPLYAFGHGLSYTTFQYEKVEQLNAVVHAGDVVNLSVSVHNTGAWAGDAVVQVYARAEMPPVSMPLQSLVAFRRVHLEPGQTEKIPIPVRTQSLRRWDDAASRYTVDTGRYELRIGPASDQPVLKTYLEIQ